MHIVFRDRQGLEETETPFDPGQDPAELIVLSFSDSDLGAFAAGWHRAKAQGKPLPSTRLLNLMALKHPVSVDTYLDDTAKGAKAILVRLIGGEAYWSYGLMSLQDLARRHDIALAVLPADGQPDPTLDAMSTVPVSTLRRLGTLCEAGGATAAQAALAQLSLSAGLYAGPVAGDKRMPDWGFYCPDRGVLSEISPETRPVLVSFYRSYLTAADTDPIDALIAELRGRGVAAYGVFAPSLRARGFASWLAPLLSENPPAAIINATAFSAKADDGSTPFDSVDCPVFQVALSTNREKDWRSAERGLSPADLAMHVVLPEVDGRIFAGAVSFKTPQKRDPDLQFSRFAHRANPILTARAVDKVIAHMGLADKSLATRKFALVLSNYPGREYQMAHAVGLDALASGEAVLERLAAEGMDLSTTKFAALETGTFRWPMNAYKAAFARLPERLQTAAYDTWGDPENDPSVVDGAFCFRALDTGGVIAALQPDRGSRLSREDDYHDTSRHPCHAYIAFYLWLRSLGIDAMIHMGAHGTLEWLPGKAVAQSPECWPEALTPCSVVYPFIVNDPGEAAQAKRRLSAVTIGHMPPPMTASHLPSGLHALEHLLDEYATADGLDPARRDRLIDAIQNEAKASGIDRDLSLSPDASPFETITQIDRFVCDIKDSQFPEGLHIFGTGPHGKAEMDGLMAALNGLHVTPGPSGSPARGRRDVEPTGRNLFTTDPRSVPSRAAHVQGVKLAEELLRKHLQDHGDWPRGLVVDLWGSATMRTAGEEFSMALHLAGLAPSWDENSNRVNGVEAISLALLGRPRIDVTLRVSGLFRDVFPGLAGLFETGSALLAGRDEATEDNPYRNTSPRVFGPAPGSYGVGMAATLGDFTEAARNAAGDAWINASSWVLGADGSFTDDRAALEARLLQSDSFVHAQDLPESDLLMAEDYAAHEAGFAAALARIGGKTPSLYHLDATQLNRPRARSLTEEIARVTRARAANPDWITSMTRHGYRGAAEIANTLDNMAAFAHLAGVVPPHLFDLFYSSTLAKDEIVAFLESANPDALRAMQDTFRRLYKAGLWQTQRNSIAAELAQ